MLNALKLIASRMNGSGHLWVLGGDTALALHGVGVSSSELTVLAQRVGAYGFGSLFRSDAKRPVQAVLKGGLTTHVGEFDVLGTRTHVIGDPVMAGETLVFPLLIEDVLEALEPIDVDGESVPVMPLEWLFVEELIVRDDDDRLALIAEESPDHDEVFDLLQRFGLYLEQRDRVKKLLK